MTIIFFYNKNTRATLATKINKNQWLSFVFALAFGKQVAKTIARDSRRQLPPLSPRSHELRGGPIGAAMPHSESKTKSVFTLVREPSMPGGG